MGAFSKTFASNGGFLATNSLAVKQILKAYASPHTFSNALSPVQCAIISTALQIVQSEEGEQRRNAMMEVSEAFRRELSQNGIDVLGNISPIVPALIGSESVARVAAAMVSKRHIFVNQVEFPAVAIGAARFRIQVMAQHTCEQLVTAARAIIQSVNEAKLLVGLKPETQSETFTGPVFSIGNLK
jgi:7-keto-8-aminopelargonate synthetase-like enzyme